MAGSALRLPPRLRRLHRHAPSKTGNQSPGLLAQLAADWGVQTFVVGHTHVAEGVEFRAPNLVILNSDTDVGKAIAIDLERDVESAEKLVANAWSLMEFHPKATENTQ